MKTTFKIFATLVVIVLTFILAYVCIEGASTSSGHDVEERRNSLNWFFVVLVAGLLFVIVIWLPWKRILGK